MQSTLQKVLLCSSLLICTSSFLFAHGEEKHEKKIPNEKTTTKKLKTTLQPTDITLNQSLPEKVKKEDIKNTLYSEINGIYRSNIKPIFEKKCFDCHGALTKKPWYYDIPGISYMIQRDIKEAKEHMDMSQDFPFISHESPYNDLKSIRKIGLKGGMPPLRYILGHWDATLTPSESKALVKWSNNAMELLKKQDILITNKESH